MPHAAQCSCARAVHFRFTEPRISKMETSAYWDFVLRTLKRVSTSVGRLAYFSELQPRGRGKPYLHWGMTRKYGESGTQEAIAAAHQELLQTWLGLSLSEQLVDFENFREVSGLNADDAFSRVSRPEQALPPAADTLDEAHFETCLKTLRAMVDWARRPAA